VLEAPIRFSEASARYPAEVAVIMKKLSAGTRKVGRAGDARLRYAGSAPEKLKWSFRWGLQPSPRDDALKDSLDFEERRSALVKRIRHIVLVGEISDWEGTSIVGMNHSMPAEIAIKITGDVELSLAEDTRQSSMSIKERNEETRKATDPARLKAAAKIERKAKSLFAERFATSGLVDIAVEAGQTDQFFNDLDAALTAFLVDFVEPLKARFGEV
jgi:hypothetical protein